MLPSSAVFIADSFPFAFKLSNSNLALFFAHPFLELGRNAFGKMPHSVERLSTTQLVARALRKPTFRITTLDMTIKNGSPSIMI